MMNVVEFPGLGLEFTLNRVAVSVFGYPIYWYGIIIGGGFLLAVLFCYRLAPRFGVDSEKLIDMLFFAVPLSILGARAYYVIFYLSLFQNDDGSLNWGKVVDIRDGGLAIYGGIIMAVLVVMVYCRVRRMKIWTMLDVGCYGLLIGQMIGRWGNFVNVEAYGGETDLPWRMGIDKTVAGVVTHMEVHPTFLYESLWNLVGLILLILMARYLRKFDGQMFLCYVIWYGVGRAMVEGLRTDSLYFFSTGIRTSQMVGIVSAAAGVVLLGIRAKLAPPATPPLTGKEKKEETPPEEKAEDATEQDK